MCVGCCWEKTIFFAIHQQLCIDQNSMPWDCVQMKPWEFSTFAKGSLIWCGLNFMGSLGMETYILELFRWCPAEQGVSIAHQLDSILCSQAKLGFVSTFNCSREVLVVGVWMIGRFYICLLWLRGQYGSRGATSLQDDEPRASQQEQQNSLQKPKYNSRGIWDDFELTACNRSTYAHGIATHDLASS